MTEPSKRPRADVLGLPVEAVNLDEAAAMLLRAAVGEVPGYACLLGAHGVVEAHRDERVLQAFQNASFLLPDGMPTVWIGHSQGFQSMDRVFGPDLMLRVIDEGRKIGLRHFLLGGRPGVAQDLARVLVEKYPGALIAGSFTPPFSPLTDSEENQLETQISQCAPHVVWLGISTPKQDLFMCEHSRRWKAPLMVGVGAAFDFHTGRLNDSPRWVKRFGLQWFHRLLQEPRRLWRRYLITNSIFIGLLVLRALGFSTLPHHESAAQLSMQEPSLPK